MTSPERETREAAVAVVSVNMLQQSDGSKTDRRRHGGKGENKRSCEVESRRKGKCGGSRAASGGSGGGGRQASESGGNVAPKDRTPRSDGAGEALELDGGRATRSSSRRDAKPEPTPERRGERSRGRRTSYMELVMPVIVDKRSGRRSDSKRFCNEARSCVAGTEAANDEVASSLLRCSSRNTTTSPVACRDPPPARRTRRVYPASSTRSAVGEGQQGAPPAPAVEEGQQGAAAVAIEGGDAEEVELVRGGDSIEGGLRTEEDGGAALAETETTGDRLWLGEALPGYESADKVEGQETASAGASDSGVVGLAADQLALMAAPPPPATTTTDCTAIELTNKISPMTSPERETREAAAPAAIEGGDAEEVELVRGGDSIEGGLRTEEDGEAALAAETTGDRRWLGEALAGYESAEKVEGQETASAEASDSGVVGLAADQLSPTAAPPPPPTTTTHCTAIELTNKISPMTSPERKTRESSSTRDAYAADDSPTWAFLAASNANVDYDKLISFRALHWRWVLSKSKVKVGLGTAINLIFDVPRYNDGARCQTYVRIPISRFGTLSAVAEMARTIILDVERIFSNIRCQSVDGIMDGLNV
eukprot:GHVU01157211.1.p1 GENE.GHVU01157211.1~~GHVU01157211.1.p1  ORF type:complete len:620 (+),score=98.02 GHVU01157211.1:78-1862(+)